jgi:hypothetical protein
MHTKRLREQLERSGSGRKAHVMNESERERNAAPAPDDGQAIEQARSEEVRSARPEETPSEEGKATTAPKGRVEGCALDTIQDDDGSFMEPPD